MDYGFKYCAILSLALSVTLWHPSEALFENVGKCDDGVLKVLNSAWGSGDPPTNILKQWKRNQPWSVLYASKDLFPTESKSVVISNTYAKVNKESGNPLNEAINWSEDQGVLKDKNLRWYVLNMDTDIFAFCICSTEGTSNTLKGGIALAMGRPGGIPDETKEAADDTKKLMTSYGVGLEVKFGLSSD